MTQVPSIDFKTMDFPSDKLTIKAIRNAWPFLTDVDIDKKVSSDNRTYTRSSLDELLGISLIDLEREIAERAFKVKTGQSLVSPRDLQDRDEMIACLTEEYMRFGLARGEHETLEFVRMIESQAESQARRFGGHAK